MFVNLLPISAAAKTVKRNKLVLLQRWDGSWHAYESMADANMAGFMIDIKNFAYFMGYDFWYSYKDNTITISKDKNHYITYKINQKKYSYQSGNKKVNKEAKYKTYLNENNNRYYVHAATLSNICNYKIFEGEAKTGSYGKKGFTHIVCFSGKEKISKLPDIKKVKNDVGFTWIDTFVSFDNIKEPGEAEILGLTFKAPEKFTYGNTFYWETDPEFIDIQKRFKDIVYNAVACMEFDDRKLNSTFDSDRFSFDYDLKAHGSGDGFYIIIKNSLSETKRQVLKAICYKISSTPETLYNVIVHDYNKEAFLSNYDCRYYGDFKISAYVIDDEIMYTIEPAN